MASELDAAMRRIGEISMENELLWEKARRVHPFGLAQVHKIVTIQMKPIEKSMIGEVP